LVVGFGRETHPTDLNLYRDPFRRGRVAAIDNPSSLGIGVTLDRDCRDFSARQEALDFFETNKPGDRHRLDDDNDGIACERFKR
jgi:hypothetical protein